MVEGARLESVYAGNRIKGSNPFLSANIPIANSEQPRLNSKICCCFKGV